MIALNRVYWATHAHNRYSSKIEDINYKLLTQTQQNIRSRQNSKHFAQEIVEQHQENEKA